MRKIIVRRIEKNEDGLEIRTVLSRHMGLSRHEISRLKFAREGITVNAQKKRVTDCLHGGDILTIRFPETPVTASGIDYRPDILYEDEDVVIVNKPCGRAVHESHGHIGTSLGDALTAYYRDNNEDFTVRAVGRLDKDVTGVMVYAKNQPAAARLDRQRQNGILTKIYLAVVEGCLAQTSGTLTFRLAKIPGQKKREVNDQGKICLSQYRVKRELKDHSLLEVVLPTGRSHQIRAGFAYYGHPLAGDALYGGSTELIRRPALHAEKVKLLSPFTLTPVEVAAPLPEDMAVWLKEES